MPSTEAMPKSVRFMGIGAISTHEFGAEGSLVWETTVEVTRDLEAQKSPATKAASITIVAIWRLLFKATHNLT